ncbi:hypothetical protein [Mangrovimonas spongiae]|uniref:Uncharacterized protein n=1 Tax=Mangrovimonas spongiae TaxID=2494697 RepID=A0A428K4K1_9FLAO|nr:hypothetical protein [Mangrovimonas spongiae]RSK41345.1 hypothetical protein EJA19_00285 [Mangrovimonas spongiae]
MLSCQQKKKNLNNEILNTTRTSHGKNQFDTLLNTQDYLILGNKLSKVKVISKNDIKNFPSYKTLAHYQSDIIIGENTSHNSFKIYRKYHPKISFKDFPADVFKGQLADPDFSTNPDVKSFITRIKNECANGINFAGHYTLVTWGCGSTCQSGVLVDRKTGKIFSGVDTSLGSKFKKDSKMIIKNVGAINTTTNLIEVCAYCEVSHHIWTGTMFKKIK